MGSVKIQEDIARRYIFKVSANNAGCIPVEKRRRRGGCCALPGCVTKLVVNGAGQCTSSFVKGNEESITKVVKSAF